MRSLLNLIWLAALIVTAPMATAEVVGLPEELNGVNEEAIEYNTVDAVGLMYGCDLTTRSIRAIAKKSTFEIVEKEEADKEDAEYPGELSSFVLNARLVLPKSKCQAPGIYNCKLKFELYDIRAYQEDSQFTACTKE